MSFAETISPFFGRCAFVWFYLTSAMDICKHGTRSPPIWRQACAAAAAGSAGGAVLIAMGSISLLFGYHTAMPRSCCSHDHDCGGDHA
jgi:hypothetical protein